MTTQAPTGDATRTAGRGGLAIAVAKVSFLLTGFVQQLVLARILDDKAFGAVSTVLAVVSIVNNVIVATSIQGVSRTVSGAAEGDVDAAYRRVLGIHAGLALVISVLFVIVAGPIAAAIGAAHVTTPLRIVGAIVLLYGLYAPMVGALNGRRRFVDQAALDIFYGVSRMVLLLGGAFLGARLIPGGGVVGAACGFVAAALLIVPIALWRARTGRAGPGGITSKDYAKFLMPLVVGQISLNLLLQTDFMLLSRAIGEGAAAAGLAGDSGDELRGVYRKVQLFSFLPYQLLMSVQFVLFPMLARAHADGDQAAVQRYVRTGVRLALLVVGLVAGVIASLGPQVLRVAFGESAAAGGDALRTLAPGMGAFAILSIACAALTSLGREKRSAILTNLTVAALAGSVLLSLHGVPFGNALVHRAAIGTASAMGVCAIIAAVSLHQAAGAFVRPLTLIRVGLAMGVVMAIGPFIPWMGKIVALALAAGIGLLYLVILVLTGEIGAADLATFRAAFGRGKKPS